MDGPCREGAQTRRLAGGLQGARGGRGGLAGSAARAGLVTGGLVVDKGALVVCRDGVGRLRLDAEVAEAGAKGMGELAELRVRPPRRRPEHLRAAGGRSRQRYGKDSSRERRR